MPWGQARLRVAPRDRNESEGENSREDRNFSRPERCSADLPFATMLDGSAIPDGQSSRQGDARRAGAAPRDRK